MADADAGAAPEGVDSLRRVVGEVLAEIDSLASAEGEPEVREARLIGLRREWLEGRESRFALFFSRVRAIQEPADRAAYGAAVNEGRRNMEARIREVLEAVRAGKGDTAPVPGTYWDPTYPGPRPRMGSVHPLTVVRREIEDVFAALGFEVIDGPEVEDEAHNFDGLNIPPDHPARDPSENFNLPGGLLLRSQTSPGQVRALEVRDLPLRVLVPGRVYRPDTVDARHLYAFHQVEGLCVGEGVSMADLKGTLQAFATGFYGDGVETRFRPSYFPFTEPSAEMDVSCPGCSSAKPSPDCSTCGGEGWMELLGCGMVHPSVLRRCGHDPERWTGFAFGMGLERAAMRRWGISDIRSLVENDVRFLEQFR